MTVKKLQEILEKRFPGLKVTIEENVIQIGQMKIDYPKARALARS